MRTDPYRRIAKWYDTLFEPLNAGLRSIGMKMFSPKEGMLVLDVGCGTGIQLELYQEAGCKVFGIDPSPSMLEVARQRLGDRADLYLGDASDMPYPDETFDLITATLTLHEMTSAMRSAVMNELKRSLKKDGRILLIDFHPGPILLPKGLLPKILIVFLEIAAGRENFKNYRDFMTHKGLPSLIETHRLSVEKEKIVGGRSFGLLLLQLE